MPEPRRLRNPPITEAIIDIRAELTAGFEVARLRNVEPLLSDSYVLESEQHLYEQAADASRDAGSGRPQRNPRGYTFYSTDRRFIAQLTDEGLTLSQIHGYTRWEDLASEAGRLWDVFVKIASPRRVVRAGTRYLNRIELPPPGADWEEYFTTLPRIPEGVPQAVSNFLFRIVLDEENFPHSVSITQYFEPAEIGRSWMILDIDAFSQETYEVDGSRMWEDLAALRELKNRVFFGSLTEKTLEMFR